MASIQTLNLISGTFTPEDAESVLMEMINTKIKYHNLKNYTSMIKYDKLDYYSKQRLKELNELQEEIKTFIRDAELMDKKLRIFSEIHIRLDNELV